MTGRKSRVATTAISVLILLLVLLVVVAVCVLGTFVAINGKETEQGNTRFSLYILLFGFFVMLAVFFCFVWIGVEDWRKRAPISPLYWPQVAVKGTLWAYMVMVGLDALDLLTHNLRLTWTFLYTPLARIFQNVLLLGVFFSFAWVLLVVLRGRADARRESLVLPVVRRLTQEIKRLKERMRAEEERADLSEVKSDTAFRRANENEVKVDLAHTQIKTTEGKVEKHEERIETVEEIVELKTYTKKKKTGD